MIEMEKLRFVDVGRNRDTQSKDEFAHSQQEKRKTISDEISKFSDKCRENV